MHKGNQPGFRALHTDSDGHRRAQPISTNGHGLRAPGAGRISVRSSTTRPYRRSSRSQSPYERWNSTVPKAGTAVSPGPK